MLETVTKGILLNIEIIVYVYDIQKKRLNQFLLKDEQYDKKLRFLNLSDIKN